MVESEGTRPEDRDAIVERKLRAIREAAKHEFPTADIEDMLREIEAGRRLAYSGDANGGDKPGTEF